MAVKKGQDMFANMATIVCTESAANTLTYKKLETSIGTFDKIAWVVHRIEYHMFSTFADFNTTADNVMVAFMTGNTRSTLQTSAMFTDPQVLDCMQITRLDLGAAASGMLIMHPIVKDFTSLPGAGLIIPPAPLYGAVQGSGMANPTTIVLRIYYTVKELATDEYWELVEARRLLTA